MKAIICDLDGTVCNHAHRKHLSHKDFDEYNGMLGADTPNEAVKEILYRMAPHHPIILITGRPEKYRNGTMLWLSNNSIPYDELWMRPDEDMRSDVDLKRTIFAEHLFGVSSVLFVLEDRDCVVDMWRSIGLTCLQVERFEVENTLGEPK